MPYITTINGCKVRLEKCDVTDVETEALVFYAREDLKLGTGYGNAIAVRGGLGIKKELDELGSVPVGAAVTTSGGNLKAKYIIHAVGPKFQEADTDSKLQRTILAALQCAREKNLNQVAFPLMGAGFYGLAPDQCASAMIAAFKTGLTGQNDPKEIVICALDNREYVPFQREMEKLK
jgi:O-acetyl-ADP-ribose deacetylase